MVRESYHIFVRVARFVPKDESGERHNPVRYSAFGVQEALRRTPELSFCASKRFGARFNLEPIFLSSAYKHGFRRFQYFPMAIDANARCPSRASEDWLRPAELPAD